MRHDSPHSPQLSTIDRGEVLLLDVEGLVGVDDGATGGVCVAAVLLSALAGHVVAALRRDVTGAVRARMSRRVEAQLVGLHDVE